MSGRSTINSRGISQSSLSRDLARERAEIAAPLSALNVQDLHALPQDPLAEDAQAHAVLAAARAGRVVAGQNEDEDAERLERAATEDAAEQPVVLAQSSTTSTDAGGDNKKGLLNQDGGVTAGSDGAGGTDFGGGGLGGGGLIGLGALGIAAAAGGGGGSSESKDAVIGGTATDKVTEGGDTEAGGTLTITDSDAGQDAFQAAALADLAGKYGTFTFDKDTGDWTYELTSHELGKGQTASDTLRVYSIDGTYKDIVVDITGANDAPAWDTDTADASGGVSEIADGAAGENANALTDSGTITFTDLDKSDTHTVKVSSIAVLGDYDDLGLFQVSVDDATNTVTWNFSVDDADIDFLGAGETREQTYTVELTDGNGGTITEDVTVTLNGVNDAPEFVAGGTLSASLTEGVGGADEYNSKNNTVTVKDVDANDKLTASYVDVSTSDNTLAEALFGADFADDFKGMLSFSLAGGVLTWNFVGGSDAFDKLSDSESLTLTYTIQVADDSGATNNATTQTLTVLISGASATVINGTNKDDTLTGDKGNNSIYGFDGKDTIDGGDGNDLISGGKNDDSISGGNGNDVINGDEGNDRLFGGAGDDVIDGGKEKDTLVGGAGNDTLTGGEKEDTFFFGDVSGGTAGTITLVSKLGVDNITDFGRENDVFNFSSAVFGGSVGQFSDNQISTLADLGTAISTTSTQNFGSGNFSLSSAGFFIVGSNTKGSDVDLYWFDGSVSGSSTTLQDLLDGGDAVKLADVYLVDALKREDFRIA